MRGNEFLINYGGEWLDVDAQSVGGFDFTTIWTLDSTRETEKGRTMDLSVPATKNNTRIFNDHKLMCGNGVRRGINGMVVAGGVNITGKIYVTEYSGGRYSLTMAYGHDFDGFGHVNYWSAFLADTIPFSGSDVPAATGGVPGFGWYDYGNQQSPHSFVGDPPTLHPVTNLGHVIDRLAAALGYTINYPAIALGRGYQAHAYGLVLPSFGVQSIQGGADVSGSAMGGFSYTLSGAGTLADLGLEVSTMYALRGAVSPQMVQIECFKATRPVHITIPDNSNVVVFGINAHTLYNDWEGTQGAEFDLAPGDYFSFARPDEWHKVAGEYYWNRYRMPPAFEGNVTVTFSVTRAASYPAPGDTMYLAYALPEHPLEWWLDAYCNIIFAAWTVDELTKTITVKTYGERLGDALADTDKHIALEKEKMMAVENVKRYIDGFAQHNHTRCAGDYDPSLSVYPFDRDLRMDNDYLPQTRDMEEIPFNDGGIRGGGDGRYYLDLNDVPDDGNGGYSYNGILTVFFENTVNSDGAVYLTEILNLGVGLGMASGISEYDITNAFSASVRLLLPLFRFIQLDGGSCVSFHGRNFVVKNAKWGEGVAQLELVCIPLQIPERNMMLRTLAVTNVTCFDGADGEIQVEAIGGTAPYTYSLNSDFSNSNNTGVFTGLAITGPVQEGTDQYGGILYCYKTVYVRDADGNTAVGAVRLQSPVEFEWLGETNLTFVCPTGETSIHMVPGVDFQEPYLSTTANNAETLNPAGYPVGYIFQKGNTYTIRYDAANDCGDYIVAILTITVI